MLDEHRDARFVTVVMAVRDGADFIAASLASVLRQVYPVNGNEVITPMACRTTARFHDASKPGWDDTVLPLLAEYSDPERAYVEEAQPTKLSLDFVATVGAVFSIRSPRCS